jgi:hypothetical protein
MGRPGLIRHLFCACLVLLRLGGNDADEMPAKVNRRRLVAIWGEHGERLPSGIPTTGSPAERLGCVIQTTGLSSLSYPAVMNCGPSVTSGSTIRLR